MNEKNKNLLLRVVSAAVLLPGVLFLLWKGGYWTAGLLAAVAAGCASEYYLIAQKRLSPIAWLGMASAAALPLLLVLRPDDAFGWAFGVCAGFFLAAWTYHLLRGPLAEAPTHAAHLLAGMLYGALGLTAVGAVRALPHGWEWLLCLLIITWGNDTAAYFAGRFFGRHKLYPAVSPNKTWEGFFGGLVGSFAGMVVAKLAFFPELAWLDCAAAGLIGGVVGPVGDLCESMLKRAYAVKDSGKLIPGHGGLLDRIDALIFNAPVLLVYLLLFARP